MWITILWSNRQKVVKKGQKKGGEKGSFYIKFVSNFEKEVKKGIITPF